MRFRILFCVSLFGASAAAQEASPDIIFLPKTGNSSAKVIYLGTMTEAPVIEGDGTKAPADCPPNAFWTKYGSALVRCGDGVEYKFVTLDKVGKPPEFMNAFGLKPKKPNFGTDDPGPMRDGSKKDKKP